MCIDAMTPILDLLLVLGLQSGLVLPPRRILRLSRRQLSLRKGYITPDALKP